MPDTELELPETMHIEPEPEEAAAPTERPRNPRDVRMAEIAKNYEEHQRPKEIAYGEELAEDAHQRYVAEHPEEAEVEVGATEQAEASEPDGQPAPLVAPTPVPQTPPTRTVTIQGQQFSVTEAQFQQLADMGALTNLALQQGQQQPSPPRVVTPADQPQRQTAPLIDDETAKQVYRRIAFGGEDDGAAAVKDLASTLAQRMQAQMPQIDPVQIQTQATQQALAHIQVQNDLTKLGEEFPEIFNNRSRAFAATANLTEIRQRDALLGQQRQPLEQYREACKMVRDAFAPQPQPGADRQPPANQAAPNVVVNPQRLVRKRSAPSNPTAVSRAAGLGPEQPRPPTPSQIVDTMRRQRGLTPLN